MPWEERTKTMLREDFVRRALRGEESFSALCREFSISRPTGYKWMARYREGAGLADRDRTPFRQPRRTAAEVEMKVLAVRQEHPSIGSRKIARILQNRGETDVPSPSTITEILRRNGMLSPEACAAATHWRRFEMEHSNDLWQADYKGHFPLLDGTECHPLNIIDDCSRFCLCSRAMTNETAETFQPVLLELFQEYGMPRAFLSDNGNPWGSGTRHAISRMDVFYMQLGILPMHGKIHHPQTQGKCESFNHSLTRELLAKRTFRDMDEMQRQLDNYRDFYNRERPHHALDLDVPSSHYTVSSIRYPGMIMEWEYPQGYRLIRIGRSGHFKLKGYEYYLGEALRGEVVGLRESSIPDRITVEYREFKIARINLKNNQYDYKHPVRKEGGK